MRSPPVHVVSLARTPERLARFTAENAAAAEWSVFPAVDGLGVGPAARDALGDTTLWSAGSVGAALSHAALWRRCRGDGAPLTVCEDDAVLRGDFDAAAASVLAALGDYDLVLWGWNFDCVMQAEMAPGVASVFLADQTALRDGVQAFQDHRAPPSALRLLKALGVPAYTVSPRGAEALLAACTPYRRRRLALPLMPAPIDNVTPDTAMAGLYASLRAFVAVPPLAATRNDWSLSTVRNPAETLAPAEAVQQAAVLEREGRPWRAVELLQAAAVAAPRDVPVWAALGAALSRQSCLEAAAGAFARALEESPAQAEVLYNLARVRLMQARPQAALALLDRAVEAAPRFALAWSNRGVARLALDQAAEAAGDFRAALALDPRLAEAHRGLAAACQAAGDPAGQAQALQGALALAPGDEALVEALGEAELKLLTQAQAQGDLAEAERRAASAARSPRHRARALIAGSNIAELQGRFDAAHARAAEATRLAPESEHALNNLGVACLRLGRLDEAEAAYRAALALAPAYADAHHGLSFALLKQERWEEGWVEYDWRLRSPQSAAWIESFGQRMWRGERRAEATLLLAAEQGFGDTLQAATLVAEAAPRVGRIVLSVPASLVVLLQRLPGAAEVVAEDRPRPPHDLWRPLMSLPGDLGVTSARRPPAAPALTADPARVAAWRARLPPGPCIGLAWQGNPTARVEHGRSFPLAELAPLAEAGSTLVSLQKGPGAEQVAGAPFPIHVLQHPYPAGDFAETAAVVAALDLVVCCDTAIAHLAGALGRPVWIALGSNPDWRWLSGRDDTVWYSSAKLWRCEPDERWRDVFARMAGELAGVAAARLP